MTFRKLFLIILNEESNLDLEFDSIKHMIYIDLGIPILISNLIINVRS